MVISTEGKVIKFYKVYLVRLVLLNSKKVIGFYHSEMSPSLDLHYHHFFKNLWPNLYLSDLCHGPSSRYSLHNSCSLSVILQTTFDDSYLSPKNDSYSDPTRLERLDDTDISDLSVHSSETKRWILNVWFVQFRLRGRYDSSWDLSK